MKFVLFATAGHVDHGKTTLIKTLTGIDTDRLPEEKKRGLSIDLGFAYLDFPQENLRLELIDVPGHERFIKNSIAGLSSASGVLLVVDAGEGVMPQTKEHLKVARAFGITKGVVALTKVDKVPEELIPIAKEEIYNLLKEEKMDMPVLPVSAKTGAGIEELKEHLKTQALRCLSSREDLPLRIVVDSAFTVRGYGTVLRGSCIEGRVKEGEKVILEPTGVSSRVRRIQNHGNFTREAVAGERVAVNLPEIEHRNIKRGFLILKPRSYIKTRNMIVELDAPTDTKGASFLFLGMRGVSVKLTHVGDNTYIARLKEDIVARTEDRFLLLSSSGRPLVGGKVLHPYPRNLKKRFIGKNLAVLREDIYAYVLKERGVQGVSPELLKKITGSAPNIGKLERLGVRVENRYYDPQSIEHMKNKIKSFVHRKLEEGNFGAQKAEVLERLSISEKVLEFAVSSITGLRLVGEYILDERKGELEKNPDFVRVIEVLKERILTERELLQENIPKDVLQFAVKKKKIHRIGNFFLLSDNLLRRYISELSTLGDSFTVQEAKERLGLTRKHLIPILEYLDTLGLTRREGNSRVWVRKYDMNL